MIQEPLTENINLFRAVCVNLVPFSCQWKYRSLLFNPFTSDFRQVQEYKVSVFTGAKPRASTTSNVFFVLAGKTGDTGTRILSDGIIKVT